MKNKRSIGYIKRRISLGMSKTYRQLTSQDRVLPDFIIIGVQKGGTSSLYQYLTRHPNVLPGYKKEVKFFDGNYQKGLDWYRYNFPFESQMNDSQAQTGEASPTYVFHPLVPRRIKESLPNVKLILLLRDPVSRAYSHYQGNVRRGHETLSFQQAIEQEQHRLEGEREKIIADQSYPMYRYIVFSYLARGIYIDQVRAWFQSFPRQQMLILKSEAFFRDPTNTYNQVLKFLGLPDWQLDDFDIFNIGSYEKMDPQLEDSLKAYFSPYNQELYELIGEDFNWENQQLG